MPIYEYCCDNCGHEFELLQKISDPAASDCPKCNQPQAKRLVSATSFRLKGSGWYETDFKNKSKPSTKTDGKKEEPSSKAVDDNKSSKKTTDNSSTTKDSKASA